MSRLINVDALKADYGMADDCKDCKTGYRSCEYDRIYSKMDFCGWLDDAPTVDAVPVRHGKWINGSCSECGAEAQVDYYLRDILTNYCPECGARMDGKGDGNETDRC